MKPREYLLENLLVDMIGPGSEGQDNPVDIENEWISESPLSRYFLGILYPQKLAAENLNLMNQSENEQAEESTQDEVVVEQGGNSKGTEGDEADDDNLVKDIYSFSPSACGLSFVISDNTTKLKCYVKAASYKRLNQDEVFMKLDPDEISIVKKYASSFGLALIDDRLSIGQDEKKNTEVDKVDEEIFWPIYKKLWNFRKQGYKRVPIEFLMRIDLTASDREVDIEVPNSFLKLKIKARPYEQKRQLITISLFNTARNEDERVHDIEKCYFQCGLEVSIEEKGYELLDVRQLQIGDLDDPQIKLLYRNKKVYAIGHGCSVSWDGNPPDKINTSFAPIHEVPRVDFTHPRLKKLSLNIFRQRNFAFAQDKEKESLIAELRNFVTDYEDWLTGERKLVVGEFSKQAEENYSKCIHIKKRMADGIQVLEQNDRAWQSFKDANKAMIMQRYHAETFKQNEEGEYNIFDNNTLNLDYGILPVENYEWRPFQLAFLLLSLNSIIDPNSEDRSVADLIWFPTGGGKTEAYLGLIAFTIFYRRLNYKERGFGTSILMRYTLRLLTSDQFKRACSLILACEMIRRQNTNSYGEEEISIGFWVGSAVSPNTRMEARKYVKQLTDNDRGFSQNIKEYPFQILNCPWCGSSLINLGDLKACGFFMKRGSSFGFHCINEKCSFSKVLPIQVVDEELYNAPPTLLFATVDKFASLPWQEDTRSFFGYALNGVQITQVHNPPELIIQDELHLISGPLGSIFGHYETVIDFLCQNRGCLPKIVCSTATVTKADEQIRAVFNRSVDIFPPSAFNIEDSYFAVEKPINETPGRLYLGLSSIGKTLSSTYIKIVSSILYHKFSLVEGDKKTVDDCQLKPSALYSTVVSYFNTLNSLAQALGFYYDDVPEKLQIKRNISRRGGRLRMIVKELTSRLTGTELPTILRELKNDNCDISVLLTTNMFSVGIDIARLNVFLMNGQPKSTSEYIQSTSRVGRRDPGFVITLYDNFRPRDKSYYENFQAFHQGFYRFVEPNGVTPFTRPVRLRALHTLAIIVFRLLIQPGDKATPFNRQMLLEHDSWRQFREFLIQRCKGIDQAQALLIDSEIESLLLEWESMVTQYGENFYFQNRQYDNQLDPNKNPLMIPSGSTSQKWPMAKKVLLSMRNVDVNTTLKLEGRNNGRNN